LARLDAGPPSPIARHPAGDADSRSPWWRRGLAQAAVYLVVGAVNTAFGYSVFALLILVGLHYAVAALLSTILGVLFNFQTIGRIVFASRDPSRIFRFVAVYGITYLLNVGALRLLRAEHLDVLLVQAVLVLPLAGLSFLLHQRFVFREEVAEP
jgi:putative flippase GtrA